MKESAAGQPQVGPNARTLGIRLGIDVSALSSNDLVRRGEGGVFVGPDDPFHLPVYRRPAMFNGTGVDSVWFLDDNELGTNLLYRLDPKHQGHGFIEPAFSMTADEFRQAIEATQSVWRKATIP
jgi:hypothetical protein